MCLLLSVFFFRQGLRGFLPGSHMCGGLPTEEAVGQTMSFKFLEVSSNKSLGPFEQTREGIFTGPLFRLAAAGGTVS